MNMVIFYYEMSICIKIQHFDILIICKANVLGNRTVLIFFLLSKFYIFLKFIYFQLKLQ